MLAKGARLSAEQVREVIKKGRALRAAGVSLKFLPGSVGKASIVASSKVAKTATLRNALRRKGYAAVPVPLPHYHMVFFIQRATFDPADIAALCSQLS